MNAPTSTAVAPVSATTLRVLIADDEPLARSRLCHLLRGEPDVEVVAECANGRDAVTLIQSLTPDLVLLDIRMPDLDGVAVARLLGPDRIRPVVIFVSAHDCHAQAAFEVQAADYLMKPCAPARLRQALQRVRARLPGMPAAPAPAEAPPLQRLIVRTGERMIVVATAEIDWIESADNYVVLHVGRAAHVLRETLAELEQRLPARHFLRLSRSAAVNPARVREILHTDNGGHLLLLADGTRLPVTRRIRELQSLLETL